MALALSLAGFSSFSHAAIDTWSGAANGTWNTSTSNWLNDGADTLFNSGNDARFTGTPTNNVTSATGLTIGAITLDNTFTGSVTMTGNNTVTGATTISSGTLQLTGSGGLGTSAATVNSGGMLLLNAGNVTYSNAILGSGTAKVITGNGDVTLTGSMASFTGTLDLNQSVGSASKTRFTTTQAQLISGSATINVNAGTTLYLNQGLIYGATINLFGAGNTENLGALRLEAGANQTGPVTLRGNSFIGVNASGATISGNIGESGGSFGFTKQGNSTLTLSGSNSYSGTTTISNGTVSVGHNNALGTGGVLLSGGTLSNTTGVTLANNFTLNNGTTFTAGSGTMTLNGNITGSPVGNWTLVPTNKITLAGSNNLTFSTNGFIGMNVNAGAGGVDITGTTTVAGAAGTTQDGYLNAAGTVTVTVQSGGSLAVNGVATNIPTSIVGQNTAGTSTLLVNGGTLTIGANTGIAFGNNIATAIGVLTVSSGTATINRGSTTATDQRSFIMLGKDIATGRINLNGGVLATDRNFVRDGSGTADVTGTANFNFGGGTLRALADQTDWLNSSTKNTNQLALTSVTTTGTSTIDANGFSVAINNAISGAGGFNINSSTGTGKVTFGGVNTYTGATTITSGTMALALSGSIAGSSQILNNATFDVSAKNANPFSVGSAQTLANNGTVIGNVAVSGVLKGTGTVSGNLTVAAGGNLSPGNSPGTQTINGDLTMSGSTARLSIELGKTTAGSPPVAGSDYDRVSVSGNVSLDGDLTLTLNNAGPENGDTFFILINSGAGTTTGTFATIKGASFNPSSFFVAGQEYAIFYSADSTANGGLGALTGGNDVALSLIAVPEPNTWAMLLSGVGFLSFWQRARRRKSPGASSSVV